MYHLKQIHIIFGLQKSYILFIGKKYNKMF